MTDNSFEPIFAPPEASSETEFFERYGMRILAALRRIVRLGDIQSRRLNLEHKTTVPQILCLYILARDGETTLLNLARRVNLGESTVVGIVDRLEAKGLVQRVRGTLDRRMVFVHATDQGRALALTAPELLQSRFAQALRRLPELELAAIALSLERVIELLESGATETVPSREKTKISVPERSQLDDRNIQPGESP